MFLEPLQHNSSLVTRSVVLLEHSFPVGKTDAMYGCNWSAVIFRYSVAFKVCFTTTSSPSDAQENVLQSIIPHPPACVWTAVHWESNRFLGRRHILTRPWAWWMTNRDSLDQGTLFLLSVVQPLYSWAQRRHSCRWRLVSRDTWVGHLPRSLIYNSARWTVCT